MKEVQKRRPPRIRNMIAFSALIMLLLCEVIVYQASQAYQETVENAKANAQRLARIMSQQIETTFLGIDNALHRAVERQYYNDLFGGTLPDYILHNMQMWVDESPRIAALVYVDELGEPVLAAHKKSYAGWLDYARHSFAADMLFRRLREGNDVDYYIGTLPASGTHKHGLILMGRKVTHIDSTFGGAFIAVIDPDYFVSYFRSVELGMRSYISLQLLNPPTMLVDSTLPGTDRRDINRRVLQRLGRPGNKGGGVDVYAPGSATDIYAFQALRSLPVVVSVVLDEDDYLESWRQGCLKDIGFLAIFTVFGSVLSFFAFAMARQIIRVEESEAAAVLASQEKSEFLANMSHELRTPLNAIIGFSEMMISGYFGTLNPKQKERMHDINLCGSHLLHLITDILEFSKGSAGKLELIEEKVNMQDIVSEALRMVNDKIKYKHMNMLVEIEANLPLLQGDKRKIRQILLNLLSNSLKFTPDEGTIKVSVACDGGGNMTMTVSDTGIGIAEDDIPTALSVFGQVHKGHSYEGTGLGLPLCKMFAEMHGGRLAIGSAVGEGTTVRILFPVTRVLPPQPKSSSEAVA
jgi:signal transduction histidine kinase